MRSYPPCASRMPRNRSGAESVKVDLSSSGWRAALPFRCFRMVCPGAFPALRPSHSDRREGPPQASHLRTYLLYLPTPAVLLREHPSPGIAVFLPPRAPTPDGFPANWLISEDLTAPSHVPHICTTSYDIFVYDIFLITICLFRYLEKMRSYPVRTRASGIQSSLICL